MPKTNDSACLRCAKDYENLNNNFEEIKKTFSDSLCFDIVDAVNINLKNFDLFLKHIKPIQMNRTRFEWSNLLKCCKDRNTSTTAFIAVSCTIGCIPVLFYLGFFFVTSRRERSEYISAAAGTNFNFSVVQDIDFIFFKGDSESEANQSNSNTAVPQPSTSDQNNSEMDNTKSVSKKVVDSSSSDDELYQPTNKLE